jgi:mannan endo-1,4-beta-mannosidase
LRACQPAPQRVNNMTKTRRGSSLAMAIVFAAVCLVVSGCALRPPVAPVKGSPAAGTPSAEAPARSISRAEEPTRTIPRAKTVEPPKTGAYLGVYAPSAPFDIARLGTYERQAGKSVSIVMWYQPWAKPSRSLVDSGALVNVWRRGKVPMITWEPWNPGSETAKVTNPAGQTVYRLREITSGHFDPYIRSWARQLADLGGPVMLRPMHEMNGGWYPWGGLVNGNTPQLYIEAWRRMHRIFAEEGATNVTWVWSINHESVPDMPTNRYAAYYPGDAYVDWTAISGFNWGTSAPGTRWRTFEHWYDKPLAYLSTLDKPICIAEIGCVDDGGDKGRWMTRTYDSIGRRPRVKAVIYYDAHEGQGNSVQDWRIGSSPSSVRGFRRAVASPYYRAEAVPQLTAWVDELDAKQRTELSLMETLY